MPNMQFSENVIKPILDILVLYIDTNVIFPGMVCP